MFVELHYRFHCFRVVRLDEHERDIAVALIAHPAVIWLHGADFALRVVVGRHEVGRLAVVFHGHVGLAEIFFCVVDAHCLKEFELNGMVANISENRSDTRLP